MTPLEIVYDIARKGPERPFSVPLPKGMKDRTEKKGKRKKK